MPRSALTKWSAVCSPYARKPRSARWTSSAFGSVTATCAVVNAQIDEAAALRRVDVERVPSNRFESSMRQDSAAFAKFSRKSASSILCKCVWRWALASASGKCRHAALLHEMFAYASSGPRVALAVPR